MSSFGERFSVLRKSVNLNRVQIAKKIGVKSTMVDRIENEQSFPRADVVQKIAEFFPDKILWLLTGDICLGATQTYPRGEGHGLIRIVDAIDVRWCEKMKIKSQFLDQLILIQTSEWNVLAGIFIVKEQIYSKSCYPHIRQAVFIESGNMNFESNHGGMLVLEQFREWLACNRPDLLLTAEMKKADISLIEKIREKTEICESDLCEIIDRKNVAFVAFEKWVAGEKWVETPRGE